MMMLGIVNGTVSHTLQIYLHPLNNEQDSEDEMLKNDSLASGENFGVELI